MKSESIFLLCALQCQSTHCNLPKVAAIYAIKHVFNIPEPHCVCVFLALPLTLSAVFLFMCVSVCVLSGNGPFRAAGLSLLTEGSSLSLGDKANRKWEFTLAYFTPQKSCLRIKSCKDQVLHVLHFATTSDTSHPPVQLSHPWLVSYPAFGVELGGQEP